MADSPRRVSAQYHWRWRSSRCCSEWEAVGSLRSNHREKGVEVRILISDLISYFISSTIVVIVHEIK